jgi:putative SOS response-associated peptidase YedK
VQRLSKQASVPGCVQTLTLPYSDGGLLRWQNTPSGEQPWYFTPADGSPLLTVAGLCDEWKNSDGAAEVLHDDRRRPERVRCAHPRQHASIFDRGTIAPWLGGEAGKDVLKPAPSAYLQRWPVSKRVNSSKADAMMRA